MFSITNTEKTNYNNKNNNNVNKLLQTSVSTGKYLTKQCTPITNKVLQISPAPSMPLSTVITFNPSTTTKSTMTSTTTATLSHHHIFCHHSIDRPTLLAISTTSLSAISAIPFLLPALLHPNTPHLFFTTRL